MPTDYTLDPAPPRLLLNSREAAKALCVCEKTLWNITAPRGPLPCVRIGAAIRFDVCDIENYIDAHKTHCKEEN